jgi:hypothetical protein
MVSTTAHIPEDAMSAGLLGTERPGHGVRIRDDGLIATIGHVVHEAEQVWVGSRSTVVPGVVVGYDFDSGFALVRPTLPLHGPCMEIGTADALSVGDSVTVMGSGGPERTIESYLVAKQEFAGRWGICSTSGIHVAGARELVGCAHRQRRAVGMARS